MAKKMYQEHKKEMKRFREENLQKLKLSKKPQNMENNGWRPNNASKKKDMTENIEHFLC